MILIFGGRHDPNIAVLADRLAARGMPFVDLRIGAEANPRLRIDLARQVFEVDGEAVPVTGAFLRHDVFLYPTEDVAGAAASALNWYQAVRGWLVSQPGIRVLNPLYPLRETNKIGNLIEAAACGLRIPPTIIDSRPVDPAALPGPHIQKPVAGGEYTAPAGQGGAGSEYPRFVQPRLDRPEMRIYRIGGRLLAFRLDSPDLDYRQSQNVTLAEAEVPQPEGAALTRLCDRLGLDFAAADFMTDGDGRRVFLEVNSQPMFAAFDRVAGGALSDAIIDALSP